MISGISSIRPPMAPEAGARPNANAGEFRSLLDSSIRQVENLRTGATRAVDQFLSGEQEDPHTVVLATQRAELAFEMFVQVRNKVTQAYQEIMRMQI